jgi:dTDP-4-amino-4,6-dideoxygalactose transaminase
MTQLIPAAKPVLGEEERAAVDRVLLSGMVVQGPEVAAFEDEFSKVVDDRRCVAVNSGTSALHLAFVAGGIGAGDEVIVPSFTFAATANSVALAGATPVFADIEPDFFCLDPAATSAQRPMVTGATQTLRAPIDAPARTVTPTASQSGADFWVPSGLTARG